MLDVIVVGGMPASPIFVLIMGVIVIVGIILWLYLYEKQNTRQLKEQQIEEMKRVKQAEQETIGGTALDRFFVECVLSSCNDFSLEKNIKRAQLLADKYKLTYPNGIQALYQCGLEAHKVVSKRFESDYLSDLRKSEKEKYDQLNRYVSFYGKDKPIAMLTDQLEGQRAKRESMKQLSRNLMSIRGEPERDWAFWGGLAEGIAGPAAGAATALKTQAENAQIRAANAEREKRAKPLFNAAIDGEIDAMLEADEIEKRLQQLKEKLIADTSTDDVMEMLKISNVSVEVSETGACTVTARVSGKSALYIYGDIPAVADGSIVAHINEDGREIGTAYMVFPVNGIANSTNLVGILLSGAHREKEQTVTFTAGKLWLMEQ